MMVKLLTSLGVVVMLIMTACSTTPVAKVAPAPQATQTESGTRLVAISDELVGKLVGSISMPVDIGMVAIATPVDVSSLEQTDWLGRELAEQFVYSLHKRGIQVYEYKIKGWLEITGQGDYIYSRNWQKLATKANVSRVLSGTLSRNDTGVMLYARLVNLKTSVVEGSGEIFIPYEALPKCYQQSGGSCSGGAGLSVLYPAVTQPASTSSNKNTRQASVRSSNTHHTNGSGKTARTTPSASAGKITAGRTNTSVSSNGKRNGSPVSNAKPNKTVSVVETNTAKPQQLAMAPNVSGSLSSNNSCTACGTGSGMKSKCHKDCFDAVTYPASTVGVGSFLVRDASGQSQYDRK